MKVVFWGEETECGTTSNLMALASYLGNHSKYRVAMLQVEGGRQSLREHFSGKPAEVVKEKCDYYALEGLDYLLSVGKRRRLDKKIVVENLEHVDRRVYCLASGNRGLCEMYPEETNRILLQVIERLNELVDVTFIDCGKRRDIWAQKLVKDADLVIVNLKQSTRAFDRFFLQHLNFSGKCMYLIGSYQRDSIYNRKNLERIYRIPEKQLAVVPYNPEFQIACERGKLDKYMQGKGSFHISENRRYFMEELEKTMQNLMEVLLDGK